LVLSEATSAGRYYTDPGPSCYWERLSGLGGTLGEIIANEFVGFNAGQWIVDISPSDRAFKTESSCSTWNQTPRRGLENNVTPGMWLVGAQIKPGIYRSTVSSGCYWERMRDFSGTLGGIIANDFVSSAGQQLVEVRSGDIGFQSDDDCGTWTPVASVTSTGAGPRSLPQTLDEIESNWMQRRRANGIR